MSEMYEFCLVAGILLLSGMICLIAVLVGRKVWQKYAGNIYTERKQIGDDGERQVENILESIRTYSRTLNDYLTIWGNTSFEIDHLFICKRGIFVIETKNLAGTIVEGGSEESEWTQLLGGAVNKIYDPVKQNEKHAGYIRRILGSEAPIYTLVVFVNADISQVQSPNVVRLDQLVSCICACGNVISEKQVVYYYESLLDYRDKNPVTVEDHVRMINERKKRVEQGLCPLCGAKLILRHGGEFYGCSRFPTCKFTKKT